MMSWPAKRSGRITSDGPRFLHDTPMDGVSNFAGPVRLPPSKLVAIWRWEVEIGGSLSPSPLPRLDLQAERTILIDVGASTGYSTIGPHGDELWRTSAATVFIGCGARHWSLDRVEGMLNPLASHPFGIGIERRPFPICINRNSTATYVAFAAKGRQCCAGGLDKLKTLVSNLGRYSSGQTSSTAPTSPKPIEQRVTN